jgi:hypothetical protein
MQNYMQNYIQWILHLLEFLPVCTQQTLSQLYTLDESESYALGKCECKEWSSVAPARSEDEDKQYNTTASHAHKG